MSERRQGRALGPLLGGLGPLRFRAESGVAVGGGAFCEVRLDSGEDVLDHAIASHRLTWRPLTYGFLSLTTARLIYTPLRWPITPFDAHPSAFALGDIASVTVEQHFKPDLVPPVADALVVHAGGTDHLLYVRSVHAWRTAVADQMARGGEKSV